MIQEALFKPQSEWKPPKFPAIRGVKKIGLDIETHDPHLRERGPGFIRGDATIAGISLAVEDQAWYFPMNHQGGGNLDPRSVRDFARDVLLDAEWIIGANLAYDLEGMLELGIDVLGKQIVDVQIAEALIDEERESYALEHISRRYLGIGKEETLLKQAAEAYGVDPKSGLWRLHSKYVGPYAEFDTLSCMRILPKQLEIMRKEDTLGILETESKLLPLLLRMRRQGITMDLEGASKLSVQLAVQEDELRLKIRNDYGGDLDEWSGPNIAQHCDNLGLVYNRTGKGNPTFTDEFFDAQTHPFFTDLQNLREVNRLRKVFVDDWVLGSHVKGRVHPQWYQITGEFGGARTGRMAAGNPNPQQIPAKEHRDGTPNPIGKKIRALFIPHNKAFKWGQFDYSQQEPRILTHYAALAKCRGAEEAHQAYLSNPQMDFYKYLVEMAQISRRLAKDMYLGRCYGMGKKKMAAKMNRSIVECGKILEEFDAKLPFIKELADMCNSRAQTRGWIRTIGGRLQHFNLWEPSSWDMKQGTKPLELGAARAKWPGISIQRANTHKGLNRLIQGSAADMTKLALLAVHRELGIVPYMQVHDEIDMPIKDAAQAERVQELMRTCVEISVPMKVDADIGEHWT